MNDFFIEYIDRCRRRVLYNVSLKVVTWWLTIALSGIVFSFIIKKPVLIPACMVTAVIVFYYYYKRIPGDEDVVSIIDKSLSLKEGLVTAFQYREDRKISDSFVSPLINQITTRLNVSRPAMLFPVSFPKVFLVWPLLIIILIFSRGISKNAINKGFSSTVKGGVNYAVNPEEIKGMDSAGRGKDFSNEIPMSGALTKDEENSPHLVKGGQEGVTSVEPSMNLRLTKDDEDNAPSPGPLTGGGQGEGGLRAFSGENKHTANSDSEMVSSVSGTNEGKDTSKGKKVIVNGRGSGKNNLSTESPDVYGKWDGKQWKASYTDAMHVLVQQDIPDDYKDYVRSYFDAVQREEQVNGR